MVLSAVICMVIQTHSEPEVLLSKLVERLHRRPVCQRKGIGIEEVPHQMPSVVDIRLELRTSAHKIKLVLERHCSKKELRKQTYYSLESMLN